MKNLYLLTITLLAVFLVSCNRNSEKTEEKPNFLIMIADDAGWNDAGAYGHPHIHTPGIDRLAEEGMLFTNAYLTISSCSPSRASIMTGQYPHNTGAPHLHMPLPEDKLIFPGELKNQGYYTAAAGKWHLGPKRSEFDTIVGGGPSGCENWVSTLKNRPKDKPFFMWFAAIDPHRGYEENIIPDPHTKDDAMVPPFLPDNKTTRIDLAMYYDEIGRLDDYMRAVLDELATQGIADNTVVIYMSDNGRPFPRCKTRLYDSGIKTPFIVRWPKVIEAGKLSHSLISSIDLAPTILDLAGANIPEQMQGTSFSKILYEPIEQVRDAIYAEHNWHDYQAHERAVRTEDYLYIRNAFPELNANPPADAVRSPTYQKMIEMYENGELEKDQMDCFISPRPAEELFDVVNDPFQLTNLADNPAYAEALDSMRYKLDAWIEKTNDTIPSNPIPDKFDRWTGEKLN
jgi:arylsulfatase A-like enzyme